MALTAARLARITQPVQLIWGRRDPFGAPAVGEKAAAILPHAELHVVDGAGHVPWIAQPRRVAELAAPFLRARSAARSPAGA